jgi:hypothetical protein
VELEAEVAVREVPAEDPGDATLVEMEVDPERLAVRREVALADRDVRLVPRLAVEIETEVQYVEFEERRGILVDGVRVVRQAANNERSGPSSGGSRVAVLPAPHVLDQKDGIAAYEFGVRGWDGGPAQKHGGCNLLGQAVHHCHPVTPV